MLTKEGQCINSVNYLGIKNIGKEITVTREESNGNEIQKTEISPYSSCQLKQESEAYYLGMIFYSLSGYDIRETVNIW